VSDQQSTPRKEGVALATIGVVGQKAITVHFNPVSLQFTISNQIKESKGTQYVATATMKLTLDLIFDTTDTGTDITDVTRQIQAFLGPEKPPGENPKKKPSTPPEIQFEWGTVKFKGFAEGYKETIDFFSIDGVPLRSSINLTLTRADRVFEKAASSEDRPDTATVDADLFDAPAQSAADVSNSANAPGAARSVAAANGQESLRFGSGAALTVGGSIELKPPVAFASGGAGLSLGAGAGLSVGGGAGFGISAGGGASFGISGGSGAGFGISGGASLEGGGSFGLGISGSAGGGVSASAGVAGLARLSASEGAFSGLRLTTSSSSGPRLDPSKLMPRIDSATAALDAGATFRVGGKASMEGGSGLRANVGASAKLSFDAS
jgi:hypothetical protein